jgi:hypothetical protein
VLVDLARTYERLSAVPRDRFLDFCHMEWRGYVEMAAEIFRVMAETEDGLIPDESVPLSIEAIAAHHALPRGPVRDQWPWLMRRTGRYYEPEPPSPGGESGAAAGAGP